MKNKIIIISVVFIALMIGLFLFRSFIIDAGIKRQTEVIGQRFHHELLKDGKLHIILVGTGTPIPNPRRVQSSLAVIVDDVFVLFDTGAGAASKADEIGLPLSELNAVFLTHLHSDHMADLPLVATKGWRYGRTHKLHVYGPEGTEEVLDGLNQGHRLDREYRFANIKKFSAPLAIAAPIGHDIRNISRVEKRLVVQFENGLKVFAFAVEHAPVEPAFGFRVEYRDRVIVISGDTRECQNIARHAKNADLLIHEGFNKHLVDRMLDLAADSPDARKNKSTRMLMSLGKQVQKYHTSPVAAAKLASQADVKKLVFTHIDPPLGPFLIRRLVTEPFFLKGVTDVFKGEIVIGEDGMQFDLEVN